MIKTSSVMQFLKVQCWCIHFLSTVLHTNSVVHIFLEMWFHCLVFKGLLSIYTWVSYINKCTSALECIFSKISMCATYSSQSRTEISRRMFRCKTNNSLLLRIDVTNQHCNMTNLIEACVAKSIVILICINTSPLRQFSSIRNLPDVSTTLW